MQSSTKPVLELPKGNLLSKFPCSCYTDKKKKCCKKYERKGKACKKCPKF